MSDLHNILSHSACLSQEQLLQYLDNKLEQEEVYIVEEHVTACMFCSDAIDGLAALPKEEIGILLTEIKAHTETKVDEYIQSIQDEDEQKIVATQGGKSRKHWVAAAGLLLLLFGGGAALFSYFNNHHQDEIKMAKNDKVVPTSNEKATIKEGSRELSTISLDESDFNNGEDEIVAKNDLPVSKKGKKVLEEEAPSADFGSAPPPPAPVIKQDANLYKEKAQAVNQTIAGSSNTKSLDDVGVSAQKKADVVAKVDAERSAKDFSSMNRAGLPKYEGKLKTTPQQNNVFVDKKSSRREAADLSQIQTEQEIQSTSGKNKKVISNFEAGYALYQQGNYKKSIRYFKKALRKKDVRNAEDIKYYLALALIQEGKVKEADDLLAELESGGTRFKESAKKARKKITK